MDVVTALVSMAVGAALVSVLSAFISFYKRPAQVRNGDIIVTIKKNGSTIEAINPTDTEIDSLIMILKSIYQRKSHNRNENDDSGYTARS